MGEFRLFWHAVRDGWRCGCGAAVTSCPVWSEVLQKAGIEQEDAVRELLSDLRTTLRIRRAPRLVAPRLLGEPRAAYSRASTVLADVYRAAAEASGARVLVDSSKDPLYGLFLARVPGIRLHVIHLVRDSRAVAWSWQRKRLRPEIADAAAYMPLRSASRTSLDWDLRNALTHVLGHEAASYARLRYETLVERPDREVASIAHQLALHAPTVPVAADDVGSHTVAGNPMRFDPNVTIRVDDEWKHHLAQSDRRVVSTLTWPLLRLYGYR